ncbi:MAG TPA: CpaD family pilus assembly lipoprotein [Allosphingosinicella sp.]|jgi:pilus assembly protein CpaD|uniref:CpaD family pilus assembly protein n=1 Tax=Allosphingosinicella sp. TaxID=2823234 RepID=UPI002F29274A
MNRLPFSAALTALALGTAACGPETNRLTPVSNPSIYSVNQPVVQTTNYVFDLSSAGAGLPASEQGRLADWFEGLDLRYGDRVYVQDAGYYGAARDDVASVVGNFGLLLSDGAPVTAGPVAPGAVRVIVTRASASVPGCPIWEDPLVGAPEQTSTNFGCATNSNLAGMIADPNDLVRGQTSRGDRDFVTGTKPVRGYRDRQPTGAK